MMFRMESPADACALILIFKGWPLCAGFLVPFCSNFCPAAQTLVVLSSGILMLAGKFGIDSSNSISEELERLAHVVSTDASFFVRHDETNKHMPKTTHDQKLRFHLNIGISTLKVAKADFLAVFILGHGPKQSAHLILIFEFQLLIAGDVCSFADIVCVFLNIIF